MLVRACVRLLVLVRVKRVCASACLSVCCGGCARVLRPRARVAEPRRCARRFSFYHRNPKPTTDHGRGGRGREKHVVRDGFGKAAGAVRRSCVSCALCGKAARAMRKSFGEAAGAVRKNCGTAVEKLRKSCGTADRPPLGAGAPLRVRRAVIAVVGTLLRRNRAQAMFETFVSSIVPTATKAGDKHAETRLAWGRSKNPTKDEKSRRQQRAAGARWGVRHKQKAVWICLRAPRATCVLLFCHLTLFPLYENTNSMEHQLFQCGANGPGKRKKMTQSLLG